jgi:hypothetical protein
MAVCGLASLLEHAERYAEKSRRRARARHAVRARIAGNPAVAGLGPYRAIRSVPSTVTLAAPVGGARPEHTDGQPVTALGRGRRHRPSR